MATWTENVVAELVRLKQAGVQRFDVAWAYAMEAFPPTGMVAGPRCPSLEDEESVCNFLERRARMEWHGECIEDYAAGLRALMASGHENFAPVRRAGSGQRARTPA